MMPHIIYLLLIASSPIYTLGDGSGSWGSLSSGPSESECRPYIEKALHGASIQESTHQPPGIDDVGDTGQGEENIAPSEASENISSETSSDVEDADVSKNDETESQQESVETTETESIEELTGDTLEQKESIDEFSGETNKDSEEGRTSTEEAPTETAEESVEEPNESISNEDSKSVLNNEEAKLDSTEETSAIENEETVEVTSTEDAIQDATENVEEVISSTESEEDKTEKKGSDNETEETGLSEETTEETGPSEEAISNEGDNSIEAQSTETVTEETSTEIVDKEAVSEQPTEDQEESEEQKVATSSETVIELEETATEDESIQKENEEIETPGEPGEEINESSEPTEQIEEKNELTSEDAIESSLEDGSLSEETKEHVEVVKAEPEIQEEAPAEESSTESDENLKKLENSEESKELPVHDEAPSEEGVTSDSTISVSEELGETVEVAKETEGEVESAQEENIATEGETAPEPTAPEEELSMIIEIPEKLRSREHMAQILRLNKDTENNEMLLSKTIESTLRDLKKLYDAAIKPLEILYKYRDLSNRHFGDPEIFSKPLILFMGPWSGGKSTIINYLLENEYKQTALRSGAEPSPAYFNIVMWGEREEVMDGTQLAADWTFSGLQKFGQGLLDRLRGLRLNHPLLQKVNIVEIPGILEIRKQVERLFPFNDACQWFIDRADIIFLVYDPSKLDVGPETEAILDQLKGREMQTRIILNKADQVKPEELMRVQGTLIWNISPLMSSTEPPVMYSTSLWSIPYEVGAPARLLYAQERAFLKDLRDAIDKRVENKIASARRFAVRVRNHAKMVDCYLTTYYNHKSFFGNKKKISDDIIEHPQNYHIYEGLSTLTNISRYDLPDPDVYRDFFRLNPVYEFQQLASTCTYFRGCPINRLDVSIAYDLPELVGKYKKQAEEVLNSTKK